MSARNLFWDSCVFIRWLTRTPSDLVADIDQFIEDAKRGRVKVHFSTLVYAEVRPRYLRQGRQGSIEQLFRDLGSAFSPIDPNPQILIAAGQLKDAQSTNPGDPRLPADKQRVIGTADAIHLMTCVFARDVLEVDDMVFHTFDDGKLRGPEGRTIPLLSFERWYPEASRVGRVAEVCNLKREVPKHPSPDLATSAGMPANVGSGVVH